MSKRRILIVDDSFDMLEVLQRQLTSMGYITFQASNVADAKDILKNSEIELLITDLQMPKINGMELVKYAAKHFPDIPALVITGFPSISGAVEAFKSGALDYVTKPFTASELQEAVEKHLREQLSVKPDKEVSQVNEQWGIVGKSDGIRDLLDLIYKVNNNKVTTLIMGESGTGKELVARAIHYSGKFKSAPFVAVNCGAIPENLLESELFGHTKGAFTGANNARDGFFKAANTGTIFLDEIGNASHAVQTRLLRVIQEKEITKVGSNTSEKIDVRIIAATNSDLKAMSKSGEFREDLYYRLNVISVPIPPLRERKEDIPLLASHFLKKFNRELDRNVVNSLDKDVIDLLMRHSWPGNIRELENVIQRAIVLCDDKITISHLPQHLGYAEVLATTNEPTSLESLKAVEIAHINKVLKAVNNNKTEAAKILGINRKTLREKLKSSDGTK
ncbi:MAG: sigma-54 dependent transcriptional regulator [Fulvivirga sp.]